MDQTNAALRTEDGKKQLGDSEKYSDSRKTRQIPFVLPHRKQEGDALLFEPLPTRVFASLLVLGTSPASLAGGGQLAEAILQPRDHDAPFQLGAGGDVVFGVKRQKAERLQPLSRRGEETPLQDVDVRVDRNSRAMHSPRCAHLHARVCGGLLGFFALVFDEFLERITGDGDSRQLLLE
jgi:hypothetical protein